MGTRLRLLWYYWHKKIWKMVPTPSCIKAVLMGPKRQGNFKCCVHLENYFHLIIHFYWIRILRPRWLFINSQWPSSSLAWAWGWAWSCSSLRNWSTRSVSLCSCSSLHPLCMEVKGERAQQESSRHKPLTWLLFPLKLHIDIADWTQ